MKFLVAFSSILCVLAVNSQEVDKWNDKELQDLYQSILVQESNEKKMEASAKFKAELKKTLFKPSSFTHPFEDLNMCKITAPDKRFRIFNWNVPLDQGEEFYEALLVIPKGNSEMVDIVELKDVSAEIDRPEDKVLKADKWFGALYYEVVPFKRSGADHYLLLGWDGDSQISNRKIIDVLSLTGRNIRFGAPVFKTEGGLKKRLIFTYSEQTSMSLLYAEKERRVVFDHLAPKDPSLEGQFHFYGPDMSFDALDYKKGRWVLDSNIEFKRERIGKDKNFNDPRIK